MNQAIQGFQGVILYRAENQRMKGVSFITEAEADLISTSSMHLLHDTWMHTHTHTHAQHENVNRVRMQCESSEVWEQMNEPG